MQPHPYDLKLVTEAIDQKVAPRRLDYASNGYPGADDAEVGLK